MQSTHAPRLIPLALLLAVASFAPPPAHAEPRWLQATKRLLAKPNNEQKAAPSQPQAEPAASPAPRAPAANAQPVARTQEHVAPPSEPAPRAQPEAPAPAADTAKTYRSLKDVDWRHYVATAPNHQYDEFNEGEEGCCDEELIGVAYKKLGAVPIAAVHAGRTGRSGEVKWDYTYYVALQDGALVLFDPLHQRIELPNVHYAAPRDNVVFAKDALVVSYDLTDLYGKAMGTATATWKLSGGQFSEVTSKRVVKAKKK
jgi:hypothetical protein